MALSQGRKYALVPNETAAMLDRFWQSRPRKRGVTPAPHALSTWKARNLRFYFWGAKHMGGLKDDH